MVNLRLSETARLAFFFVIPRLFDFFNARLSPPRQLRDVQNHSTNETARPVFERSPLYRTCGFALVLKKVCQTICAIGKNTVSPDHLLEVLGITSKNNKSLLVTGCF